MQTMESKDNRSKDKRSRMKQHSYNKKGAQRGGKPDGQYYRSGQMEPLSGLIDVADSSDEQKYTSRSWGMQQRIPDIPRYDEFEDDANAQMQAGDFQQMSELPTAVGAHFRFSSEKMWDTIEEDQLLENTEAGQYFTLNLKLLNAGLQTIPFHKRMDLGSSLFTADAIMRMEKNAENAEKIYQSMLAGNNAVNSRPQTAKGKQSKAEVQDPINAQMLSVNKVELTNTQDTETNINPDATSNAGVNEDIQQWLDSVLDE